MRKHWFNFTWVAFNMIMMCFYAYHNHISFVIFYGVMLLISVTFLILQKIRE